MSEIDLIFDLSGPTQPSDAHPRRRSDLVKTKSEVEAAKERKRYEIDVPPVEEDRHKNWKTNVKSGMLRAVNKNLIRTDLFENIKDKNKESFITALEVSQKIRRR